ncbi:MAG: helix-turn-helix domain-containing protein [Planctomycetota bacterium]|nr:helix-turn-helix domain-containing protein [Planctomycetota bacterium]
MPASSRRPLTVTARITVEIENAAELAGLLRQALVQAFGAAVPAARIAPAVAPRPPVPTPPPKIEPPQIRPSPPQVKPTPTQAVPDENLLLDTKQVAELLGVGERTLWRWSRSGIAPRPLKIVKTVRWSAVEVREWVAAGCPREEQWEKMKKGRP